MAGVQVAHLPWRVINALACGVAKVVQSQKWLVAKALNQFTAQNQNPRYWATYAEWSFFVLQEKEVKGLKDKKKGNLVQKNEGIMSG